MNKNIIDIPMEGGAIKCANGTRIYPNGKCTSPITYDKSNNQTNYLIRKELLFTDAQTKASAFKSTYIKK